MAATIVQSAEGTSTLATVTASFATTPTNGNIIVLCFAADDYNGTPNAGWTQSTGMAIEGGSYHGGYVWWKVASGGSNSFQYTIGSASPSAWVLLEISGLDGSPYDVSNGQYVNASGYQYTTPSITPSAGDRFVVAAFGGSNASSGDISGDFVNWTNSFTHALSAGNPGTSGTRDCIGVGYRSVTANGSTSYSTGVDFPNTVQSRSGMIIAFKVASGGGGSQTLTGTLFTNTNTFYGGTVQRGAVTLSGSLFTNSNAFYAGTVKASYTVAGTLFTNTNSFYGGTVVPGAVTLAGSLFTDPDGFYGGTVSQSGAPQTLVGSLFANSQTFYGGNVRTSIALDGSLFTDGDTFYGGTVLPVYVITGTLYTDPDVFYGGVVVQPDAPQVLVGQLYANDNQFFGGVVIGGAQPTEADQPDTHDGRVWDFSQSERDEQERTDARRASEKQLRRAIERAVKAVHGSGEVPSQAAPLEASRPQVADLVLLDINTNGLSASLESIERLLAQYEAQIADEELENDALALLLMAA